MTSAEAEVRNDQFHVIHKVPVGDTPASGEGYRGVHRVVLEGNKRGGQGRQRTQGHGRGDEVVGQSGGGHRGYQAAGQSGLGQCKGFVVKIRNHSLASTVS
ncbi:hypothetical protein Taro_004526 [Colocasia esculenta]|uniref:Uncharacterized protein n=1 Tax=Colocasia esculenta TaxID=4460 RepID=A0A843TRZ2_COLES|nr:hypothetical protein [Colocasia esculenta]